MVVMAFDEKGQADSLARKLEVCRRSYRILTEEAGVAPEDIIFDPNILTVATGIEEHNNYAVDFIEATRQIKAKLPYAKVSGGVSNISFSFRGHNVVREAMHSAFLYRAIQAGLDMAIVNAGPARDLRRNSEGPSPSGRGCFAESPAGRDRTPAGVHGNGEGERKGAVEEDSWRKGTLEERLAHALVKGIADYIEEDTEEARQKYGKPLAVIEGPLMSAMNIVGDLIWIGADVSAAGRQERARDEKGRGLSAALSGSGKTGERRHVRERAHRHGHREGRRSRYRQKYRRRGAGLQQLRSD